MPAARKSLLLKISLPAILFDHATKYLVEHRTPEDWVYTVIPGFFDLVHRHNRGVAFSMLADFEGPWLTPVLIGFAIVMIGVLVWLMGAPETGGPRTRMGLALIAGGATGNVLDRIVRGSVVDFADFYVGIHHWPAFNVADSAIFIGACFVIFDLLFVSGSKSQEVEESKSGRVQK